MLRKENPDNNWLTAYKGQEPKSITPSLKKVISVSVLSILISVWLDIDLLSIRQALAQDNYKWKPFEETNIWKTEKKIWIFEEKMYKLWQKLKGWEEYNADDWYFDILWKLMDRFNEKPLKIQLRARETASAIIEKI